MSTILSKWEGVPNGPQIVSANQHRSRLEDLSASRGLARTPADPPPTKVRMKLGTQFGAGPSDNTENLAALGVNHICSGLPSARLDEHWSVEGLSKLKERVESFGLQLLMVPLPLSSSPIDRADFPSIMLGMSPERDRAIEEICQMIRNAARAGIPAVKYNLTLLGVPRTPTRGRGGALYSTFNYDIAKQDRRSRRQVR